MAKIEIAHRPESLTGASGVGRVYLLLTLVVLFWGGNFIAAKFAVPHIPPFTITAARFTITSLCLLLLVRLSRGPQQSFHLSDLPLFAVLGATGYVFSTGLFYTGMRVASATEAAIILATNPAITVVLAAIILRERLTLRKIGGLVLAFAGAALVATGSKGLEISADHTLADLILIAGGASFSLYSVLGKFAMRRYSPLAATAYSVVAGTVLLIPISIVEGGWGPALAAPADAWIAIVYMAIFSSVVAGVAWYHGIQRIGASRTALFNNGVPVAVMFLAAIILHEAITLDRVIGVTLVISGILLANMGARR